jgi:hypothetical protein
MPRAAKSRAAIAGAAAAPPVPGQAIELPPPASDATRRDRTLLGLLFLAIGGIWVGLPLHALLSDAPPPLPGLGAAGACALIAVGAGHLLWALDLLLRRHTLTIEESALQVATRGLTGVRRWHEPLANYRGVRCRHQRVYHRYGWRTVHVLELAHADPAKVIVLLSTRDAALAEACARDWASALGLPLLTGGRAAPRGALAPLAGGAGQKGLAPR